MSNVWLCIPARRNLPESTIPAWIKAGYKIAICRESWLPKTLCDAEIYMGIDYPGWSLCTNLIIHSVMMEDGCADWFVCGGDDTLPDPVKSADQIAVECKCHFNGSFGVMQPTGDPWSDSKGRTIERIAGSPWIGREFARRVFHGGGPLYAGFTHSFADEHLQCVAEKLGVFWQRPDLIHEHKHWARNPGASMADCPDEFKRLYSQEQWKRNKALFERLKAGGFKEAYDLLD